MGQYASNTNVQVFSITWLYGVTLGTSAFRHQFSFVQGSVRGCVTVLLSFGVGIDTVMTQKFRIIGVFVCFGSIVIE